MWIGEIDVDDDALLGKFWLAGKEGDAYGRQYPTFWTYPMAASAFRRPTQARRYALAAMDGEQVLGTCEVELPLLDNTHLAEIELLVPPQHRNHGVGSGLLDAAVELVEHEERRTMVGEVTTAVDGTPSPGLSFMSNRGFSADHSELHRVLDLPVPAAVLDELAAEAAAYRSSYSLVQWGNRMPEEYIESYCALMTTFNTEAPTGDLEIEPEHYDADRIRERESKFDEQGRSWYTTAAVDPYGEVVGITEMCIEADDDTWAAQSETIVAPAARGSRLGMAMKVANLRTFTTAQPQAKAVHSWNDATNGPMVAINQRLGFADVEQCTEMQRHLP